MNYDTMSVQGLLDRYVRVTNTDVTSSHYEGQKPAELERTVSALRKAVIREASVGEVTVKVTESEDELTAPVGSPDRIVTCSEQIVSQAWVPEGKYNLVPKETP
jgi:hypothetical protein